MVCSLRTATSEPRGTSERAVYCRRFGKPCISSGGGASYSNSLMPIKAPPAAVDRVWVVTTAAVPRFVRMRIAATAVLVALLVAGCGKSEPKSAAPSQAKVDKALAGSPPRLASLHKQANQLIGGDKSDFQARMAQLKGHPVVVNKWASWCAPCRGEFPVFQQAALKLGNKVAFLGLDGNDNDGNARKFLKSFPVTYPSYRDPDDKIASSLVESRFIEKGMMPPAEEASPNASDQTCGDRTAPETQVYNFSPALQSAAAVRPDRRGGGSAHR